MKISLDKTADLSLRRQLAEQIVFLITTGKLRPGERLPSVRTLARLAKIHHNTVSEAYQDLVRRKWLTRKRGSRLVVGAAAREALAAPGNLDELINDTIRRARNMGFSLSALTDRVRERLLAQPPDYVLIVEDEPGLRAVIGCEVRRELNCRVEHCSVAEFAKTPAPAVGAQIFAPAHLMEEIRPYASADRPVLPIIYSQADDHLIAVRGLKRPSVIAVVSISESLVKTAEGLLAPAIGRRHSFRGLLARQGRSVDLRSADLAFCDSVMFPIVKSRRKIHYQLVARECLENLAEQLSSTAEAAATTKPMSRPR
ncbi:MAG TPA: GntR family transcriptional regulator [Candidatus Acidoferrales bacterium]|jgi:DNA-binding transcriptional regulator YhcF (GntR family)|nr:GntR family transcriptional regulator [Candidatus Acidoferrales bacterium]